MKTFVKCEICKAEIPADKCLFATDRKVFEGKEYIYCCPIMVRKHMFNRVAINCAENSKSSRSSHGKVTENTFCCSCNTETFRRKKIARSLNNM